MARRGFIAVICNRVFLLLLSVWLDRFLIIGVHGGSSSGSSGWENIDLVNTHDFYTLRVNDVFIDKSLLIEHIVKKRQLIARIARPSGWGKSTNLDMLRRFYEIEVNHLGERVPKEQSVNWKLFHGGEIDLNNNKTGSVEKKQLSPLRVTESEEVMELLGEHPVIHVSFEQVAGITSDEIRKSLVDLVADLFRKHRYILNGKKCLNQTEQKRFDVYCNGSSLSDERLVDSLRFLSESMFRYFHRGVYIFIDDYHRPSFNYFYHMLKQRRSDNPALSDNDVYAAVAGHQDLHRVFSFLEGILYNCLDNNGHLKQAVISEVFNLDLTGALYHRVRKAYAYTFMDSSYIEYYGFTESEVSQLLRQVSFRSDPELVRSWYAYNFTDIEMYNPYSVRRFLANHGKFQVYWRSDEQANSNSLSGLVADALTSNSLQEDVQHLLDGRKLQCEAGHSMVDMFSFSSNLKMLLCAGYLSASPTAHMTIELNLPNREIEILLKKYSVAWLCNKYKMDRTELAEILYQLSNFQIKQFQDKLRAILPAVPSDSFKAEVYYNGLMKGLTYCLKSNYTVEYNLNTIWSPNMFLVARPESGMEHAIIIYYKVVGISKELEPKAKTALERMNTKLKTMNLDQYKHVKRVLKLVLVFCRDLLATQYQIDEK